MQRSNPFARAAALFAVVQAAAGDFAKLSQIPEYESRGKGRGLHSGKKWGSRPSWRDMVRVGGRWMQKENGVREVARRQRQIAAGHPRNADGLTYFRDGSPQLRAA